MKLKTYLLPLLAGSLVSSVVGGVLLLVTDFGGWYYRAPYGDIVVDRWGSIGLLSGYFPLVIVFSAALFYSGYVSFTSLRTPSTPSLTRAYRGSLAVFLSLLLTGIIFAFLMIVQGLEEWWLDTGFYGGTFGSGLSALLLRLASAEK